MATRKTQQTRFERMLSAARTNGTSSRRPWRHRRKRIYLKLSNAEKALRHAKRAEKKATYQEDVDSVLKMVWTEAERIRATHGSKSTTQIYEDIMQSSKLKGASRKVNRFNAFMRKEMKVLNAGLSPDDPRKKVDECAFDIAEKWRAMTEEEKEAATADEVKELEDGRDNKHLATHNSAMSTFHDFRTTMDGVNLELQRLNARTGSEVLLIAVRSNVSHFHRPEVFATSDRPIDFVKMAFKQPVTDIAAKMEGFMISGVEGMVKNHQQRLLEKKKHIRDLVFEKLKECAGRNMVNRMYYTNFADKITRVHGVIVKNWPLPNFCNPSSINSMAEVDLLLNAWNSGTTHFYKLTRSEYAAWEEAGFDAALAISSMQSHANNDGDPTNQSPASPPTMDHPTPTSDVPPAMNLPAPTSSAPAAGQSPTPSAPTQTHMPAPAPLTTGFVNNTVMGVDGQSVMVTAKKRKKRSDAGKPRKKRAVADQNNE